MNKENTCAISGLRPHKLPSQMKTSLLIERIEDEIGKSIMLGYTTFLTGMAMGVDIWAAESVLKFKKDLSAVKLACYLPCETQANRWPEIWREKYFDVLAAADSTICVSPHYSAGCMQRRNQMMINEASRLISVFDNKSYGGTSQTIDYAKKHSLDIVIINPLSSN